MMIVGTLQQQITADGVAGNSKQQLYRTWQGYASVGLTHESHRQL